MARPEQEPKCRHARAHAIQPFKYLQQQQQQQQQPQSQPQ